MEEKKEEHRKWLSNSPRLLQKPSNTSIMEEEKRKIKKRCSLSLQNW